MVPKHFFVPDIIEKRKPLAETARRAGWIGCNIVLKNIPNEGRKVEDAQYALSNSLGFGGHNCVLCLKKWNGK